MLPSTPKISRPSAVEQLYFTLGSYLTHSLLSDDVNDDDDDDNVLQKYCVVTSVRLPLGTVLTCWRLRRIDILVYLY